MNDPVVPLIRMINQISLNNRHHESDEAAAEQIAGHLKKFWARDMKRRIVDYADRDGSELDPLSRLAVARLRTMSDVVRDWGETSDAG